MAAPPTFAGRAYPIKALARVGAIQVPTVAQGRPCGDLGRPNGRIGQQDATNPGSNGRRYLIKGSLVLDGRPNSQCHDRKTDKEKGKTPENDDHEDGRHDACGNDDNSGGLQHGALDSSKLAPAAKGITAGATGTSFSFAPSESAANQPSLARSILAERNGNCEVVERYKIVSLLVYANLEQELV